MDYLIETSEDGKYLRIAIKANVTTEIAYKWTDELVELTRNTGIKKYLFDSRKAKNISNVSDNYRFSYDMVSKLKLDKSIREAILVSPGDHSHDFIETTKINAGYDAKIFTDESEAIKWLEE